MFCIGMNQGEDINEIFYSIACSEEDVNRRGYDEGYKIGKEVGWKEGHHLGYHKGAESGCLIGYYAGFVDQLMKVEKHLNEQGVFEKVCPTLQKLKRLTEEFPQSNDPSVDILSILDESKLLYKKLCALLKIKSELPEAKFITY
ncbi:uncharacterized protein [Rhodnius prolixus]|uniref:uncharacterized protein n=1 Tax=Rhodnius prolixus TaxID=13249 RepID=UPI003D18CFB2